jgi:diguanylate cyclase (GGDEF)-like protein
VLFLRGKNVLGGACLLLSLRYTIKILGSVFPEGGGPPFVQIQNLLSTLGVVTLLLAIGRGRAQEIIADFRQSILDRRTGLYEKNFFRHRLREETARAKRYKHPLALIILGIDSFQGYNNKYGRRASVQIVASTSQILLKNLRDVDMVVMYGEGEFAILLPETGKAGARVVAERITGAIREQFFASGKETFRITLSGGLASMPEDAAGSLDIEQKAYRAMHRARNGGGTRIMEWGFDSTPS